MVTVRDYSYHDDVNRKYYVGNEYELLKYLHKNGVGETAIIKVHEIHKENRKAKEKFLWDVETHNAREWFRWRANRR